MTSEGQDLTSFNMQHQAAKLDKTSEIISVGLNLGLRI
jgi:hypothetical protein